MIGIGGRAQIVAHEQVGLVALLDQEPIQGFLARDQQVEEEAAEGDLELLLSPARSVDHRVAGEEREQLLALVLKGDQLNRAEPAEPAVFVEHADQVLLAVEVALKLLAGRALVVALHEHKHGVAIGRREHADLFGPRVDYAPLVFDRDPHRLGIMGNAPDVSQPETHGSRDGSDPAKGG